MAAAAALTASTVVATSSPAGAASWNGCKAGYSCYWGNTGTGGVPWLAPSPGWHTLYFHVYYLWNRGGSQVWFYNSKKADPNKWDGPYKIGYQGSVSDYLAEQVYIGNR
ncbi:hypothetical protein Airi01_090680 [Actinoallomurus iriomotensis]|uniref:Peptidase inhibitor family I36 n=1 Tax=Actinoallomurus iriomotensis TaxID=478107 RepID=A0A9W6RQS7_9ACTN|nr:hypothetical protein Airi01_090680 [Actinoallomurus iriomotensis]